MWMMKSQEKSSKNHVIHKVNFMVITKVIRLMLPNIVQSEQEWHILNPCQIACPSIPVMNTGSFIPEIWGFKGWQPCPFCRNSQSLGGPYLLYHWWAILRYSFCRGRDILDIHPSITLSILLVEHSCCTYMEAVTYVFQCVINIFL